MSLVSLFFPISENLSSPNVNLFQYILFNLTSISTSHIPRAEVHLDLVEPSSEFQSYYHHWFKNHRMSLVPPIKLQLFLIRSDKEVHIDTALFYWRKAHWISVDITSGLQELFLKTLKLGETVFLGFRFKTISGKVILPASILKYKSRNGKTIVYTDTIERMKKGDESLNNMNTFKTEYMKTRSLNKHSGRSGFKRTVNFPRQQTTPSNVKQTNRKYKIKHRFLGALKKTFSNNRAINLSRSKRHTSWKDWSDNELTLKDGGNGNKTIYHYQIEVSSYEKESSNCLYNKEENREDDDIHVKNNVHHFRPNKETGKFSSVLFIHLSENNQDEVNNKKRNLKATTRTLNRTPPSVRNDTNIL